jgi:hypothetical protein
MEARFAWGNRSTRRSEGVPRQIRSLPPKPANARHDFRYADAVERFTAYYLDGWQGIPGELPAIVLKVMEGRR